MTNMTVKASESFCALGRLYAEEEGNPGNWRWLSDEEAETLKAGDTLSNPDHREYIAADDGMQAAVGAAHVEPHDEGDGGTVFEEVTGEAITGFSIPDDHLSIDTERRDPNDWVKGVKAGDVTPSGMEVLSVDVLNGSRIDEVEAETMIAAVTTEVRHIVEHPDFQSGKAGFLLITAKDIIPNVSTDAGFVGNLGGKLAVELAQNFAANQAGVPLDIYQLVEAARVADQLRNPFRDDDED